MKQKILAISLLVFLGLPGVIHADEVQDIKTKLLDVITQLTQKYEAQILSLTTENAALKKELTALKWATPVVVPTPVSTASTPTPTVTSPASVTLPTGPKSEVYTKIVNKINASLSTILADNNLSASGAVGLFEFIEPNAFFISIDDGKNPAGVTAFKTKIAFTYDANLNFTKVGVFDLDYTVQRYKTIFGTNPYTKSTRIRVQNPLYKGKLFEVVPTTAPTSSTTVAPTTSTPATTDVTFAQIKAAYDKNKLLDVIKLSEGYMVKNPNDAEMLKLRYRSYYIIGKYDESLLEVKKIEAIQWASFEKTIACDAAVIAKISKKTDVSTYYSGICKKK